MKKLFKLALVGTMVLAAVACQREQVGSSSVEANENGVKEVATQFVLNVASAPQTKMSTDVVQLNHNFRGMDNAKIFVYNTGMVTDVPATTKDAYVLKTSGWAAADYKFFELGTLYTASSIHNAGNGNDNENLKESSNRVLQLSLPVGTDAVLIYGKAIKGENAKSAEYGGTNMDITTFDKDPDKTIIAAQKILDTQAKVNQYDATADLMIYLINDILGVEVEPVTGQLYGFSGTSYPVSHTDPQTQEVTITYNGDGYRDLSWNALGHQYEIQTKGANSRYKEADGFGMGRTLSGLEEVLGRCYFLFTEIKDGEYRAGSSGAVKRMIADMYKVINDAYEATPTNEYEANAKRLADAILKKAMVYFSIASKGDYYPLSEIHTSLGAAWQTKWDDAKDLNGYPFEDFGIPRGAAQLAFGREGQAPLTMNAQTVRPEYVVNGKYDRDFFYYLHPNKPLVNHNVAEFEPRKYLYPAELWYYVNSPIRVTNKTDLLASEYPNGVTPWSTEASWTAGGWTKQGKVLSSTRGVAVRNSINYGVALLKTSVALPLAQYADNRAALTDDATDRVIQKGDLNFVLTGILVGGVNPRMNWQFTRKYTSGTSHEGLGNLSLFDGVIYDSSIVGSTVPTPTGEENYTLVYDNYNSSGTQDKVYIALEFKNNGDAFWGKHNLIPKDGYFYLVAEIPAPALTALDGKWPTDHQIPPVWGVDDEVITSEHVAGESKKIPRVFIQDFMTDITFKLKDNALKNAYYTMPDLRAAQMSFGLSVDLQWIPGLVYDDIEL